MGFVWYGVIGLLVIFWARLEREHSNPTTLHRLNRVRLSSSAAAFRWPETVWLNVFLINPIYWLHHNVYSKLSFDLRGGARICINRGWILPLEPISSCYLLHLILQYFEMANSRAFFSDLKSGKCSSIVEARLLRFWEARNVKRGGDLT